MLETSATWAVMTSSGEPQSPLRLVWHDDGERLACWWTAAAEELPTTVQLRPVA